ncbi:2-hydroxycarboxylate transporter family protein [Biostraticola tofi]|uniref:Na+/citrate or Na+/malate symporter n=1 Tax=Biostraticola tofi TaxID=466109 RepID=A0A4R3YRY3_9GAMM|nr:Na+/citrate or Na+/malate symporter [Biostraticola tofi]
MNIPDDAYFLSKKSKCKSFMERGREIIVQMKIGIFPLPLFLLAGGLITFECINESLSSDIVVMVATLAFFGFACAEFGKRLPIVGKMGAAPICAAFIPSALVYYGFLPDLLRSSISSFFESSHILYLYICCIIVGSIMSMNRTTLIQGVMRIFFPLLCGEVVGMSVGMGVGMALGMEPFHLFFFLLLPIMAGGIGEGAIPLSMGYAVLLNMDQGTAFGRILPIVMLGSLTAIIIAGSLNQLGKRFPHLTGEGELLPAGNGFSACTAAPGITPSGADLPVSAIASGVLLAVLLYMVGMLIHRLVGLPAPVGMLFAAVIMKLCHAVSPEIQAGSKRVYCFFQASVTYPILFAVGVAITPWEQLVDAFTLPNLLVIASTLCALVGTGYLVGTKIGMHPIDVAIISCCQSGQGGTGDVAILTAGNRMMLMPFAQIATRIGGAINVSLALLLLSQLAA